MARQTKRQVVTKKFLLNVLKFTAPALAVLFTQLAMGVDWRAAGLLALLTLWGLLADFFSKLPDLKS